MNGQAVAATASDQAASRFVLVSISQVAETKVSLIVLEM